MASEEIVKFLNFTIERFKIRGKEMHSKNKEISDQRNRKLNFKVVYCYFSMKFPYFRCFDRDHHCRTARICNFRQFTVPS